MKNRILIVEDDRDLGNLLKQYLELNGFEVTRVFDGTEARTTLLSQSFQILIVDVMMPHEDGFELARHLKEKYPDQPFLFVTARNRQEDILQGLRLGADDYLTKPFDADELILRVNNIIRRTKQNEVTETEYAIGTFHFQRNNLLLISPTEKKTLTEKEAALLHYLYTRRNELISRQDILFNLWGEPDFFNGRSMDVFISRLRKYLSNDPSIRIESIRGAGFRFVV